MPQVVDTKLQLKPLARQRAGRRHHAGVVEQQIQTAVARSQQLGPAAHALKVSQIELEHLQAGFAPINGCSPMTSGLSGPRFGQQLCTRLLRLGQRAAGQHHGGAFGQQGPGTLEAQAAVGAGDQGDATCLVGHGRRGPALGCC